MAGAKSLPSTPSDTDTLALYALYKQATIGPCTATRPGMLDFVGRAKHDAHSKLGAMSATDAKASYTALVSKLGGGGGAGGAGAAAASPAASAPAHPTLLLPTGSGVVYRTPLDAERGIVAVVLNAPPANALGVEVLGALNAELRACVADGGVAGVVLASSAPAIFSAGLDIREMAGASEAAFARYWSEIQATFSTLYALPKPVAAAINGAAPAGGCWLALQCDHRVIAGDVPKAVMGLNEVALGIVAPTWFAGPLVSAVGARRAEEMLALAQLLPPRRLLEVGAVDEVLPAAQVLGAAAAAAARYAAVPAAARGATKLVLRAPLLDLLSTPALRAADLAHTWRFMSSPPVQEGLRLYLERLSKRKG